MKKRVVSRFEKEWARDNKGRVIPFPLVDGDFQSSYFFSLIDEFKWAASARVTLTLALGMVCAVEQAGREVLRFKHPTREYFGNRECFDEFLQKYMGYRKIASNRYDIVRNGIVHGGFPKSESWGVGIDPRRKLKKVRGMHIYRNGHCDLTLSVLLKEFENGVRKLRWHEIKYKWSWAGKSDF